MNNWVKLVFIVFMLSAPANMLWGQCASIYKKAETLMSEGKYRDAIKNFKAAMQCDNNLTETCEAKIAECEKKLRYRAPRVQKTVSYGLTVEKDSLTFDSETTSNVIVRVQSTPEEWTATSDAGWCKAVPLGNRVSVSCEINDNTHERTARVTVSNEKKEADIVVVQKGKKVEEYIRIEIDKLEFSGKGEIKEVHVDSNAKWDVADIADWCEVVVKKDDILILKTGMGIRKEREGTLILRTSEGKIASMIIVQKRKGIF